MHLVIAKKVCEQLKIDSLPFYYGNLIPDAHENTEEKRISHFIKPNTKFGRMNMIDEKKFQHTYEMHLCHPVVAGYYAHLISDQVWLNEVYTPLMVHEGRLIQTQNEDYYKDFTRMNRLLIEKYQLSPINEHFENPIKEYNESLTNMILQGLKKDFEVSVYSALKLMNLEHIEKFIAHSVKRVVEVLGAYYETYE